MRANLTRWFRSRVRGSDAVRGQKMRLIEEIGRAESVRDYGGLWGVDGWYLAQAVRILQCRKAWMVDSLMPSESWLNQQDELNRTLGCKIETRRADFRDRLVYFDIEAADVSLLYDVLLHNDVACEVIKNVCSKTTKKICVAQPVLKERRFSFPNACVNLQFAPASLKQRLRKDLSCWPAEPEVDYFEAAFWIWGQTRSFLSSVFYGYGFDEECGRTLPVGCYRKTCGVGYYRPSKYFDYAFLRYQRRNRQNQS